MLSVSSAEFQQNIGRVQLQAREEPVEIATEGRRDLVLMSATHYDWLTAAAKRSHRTAEASPAVLAAVRLARMDPVDGVK